MSAHTITCAIEYAYVCVHMYVSVYVGMCLHVRICMREHVPVCLFHQLYSANCVLTAMYKGEAYISTSLLLPPFSIQYVTS